MSERLLLHCDVNAWVISKQTDHCGRLPGMLVPSQESQELGAILERAECDGSPVFLLFLGDDAAVMPQGFFMLR